MVISNAALAAQYNLLGILFVLGFFLILLAVVCSIASPTKSRRYRKLLADLFVAGRIKQLAEDKGIDIPEEFESFKRFKRKENLDLKDLDNTIEEDLKEEIGEEELYLPKEVKEAKSK